MIQQSLAPQALCVVCADIGESPVREMSAQFLRQIGVMK
jgi:hypothetical protein